eukprot:4640043-Pyramimonas_sp.AAC.1
MAGLPETGYEVTRLAMGCAKELAQAGIEDEIVEQKFSASEEYFIKCMGPAIEDGAAWLMNGIEGRRVDMTTMRRTTAHVQSYVSDLLDCSTRWSSGALREHLQDMMDGCENSLRVSCWANFVMVADARDVLVDKLRSITDANEPSSEGKQATAEESGGGDVI